MLLDNFLDFAHFPFVHRGTFGAEEEREVEPYAPQVEGDVVQLRLDFVDAGGTNTVVSGVQPETAQRCRISSSLFRDDLGGDEAAMAEAVAYEQRILEEDLAVQEALDDLRLPLTLPIEVHTRADRITVELRRALACFVAEGLVPQAARPAPAPRRPRPTSRDGTRRARGTRPPFRVARLGCGGSRCRCAGAVGAWWDEGRLGRRAFAGPARAAMLRKPPGRPLPREGCRPGGAPLQPERRGTRGASRRCRPRACR
jgi:hypothetical protein